MAESMKVTDPSQGADKSKYIIGGIVLLIIAALVGGFLFLRNVAENREIWDMSRDVPDNLSVEYIEDDGIGNYVSFRTQAETPNVVDVFEDPSCSYCKEFAMGHGEFIEEKVASGEVEFNAHMLNFMDESSGMTYSDDASAVLIELAKTGDADNAWRVYNEMWDNQPGVGTPRDAVPTMDDMIAALESAENTPDEAITALKSYDGEEGQRIYDSTITNTDALTKTTQRVSTPTVFVNGDEQQFEIGDNEYFESLFN